MNNLHAKSPCCREKFIRYGKRRRQCFRCGGTWRIRKKRRGRKRIRIHQERAHRYLVGHLYYQPSSRVSYRQFKYRVTRSRNALLVKELAPAVPADTPCLVAVDAMINKILGKYYATYIVLIRPLKDDTAIIYEACTLPGYENGKAWTYVLTERIPQDLIKQIKALICDGARIFPRIAATNGWVLQRCHFHLLAALHTRLSGRRMRKRYRLVGKRLTALLRTVITSTDEAEISSALVRLRRYQYSETVPITVRERILRGFLQEYQEYRTYLMYPELNLPRTTGSCEAMVRIFRKFLSRTHGISSPEAFDQWIRAIVAKRKTIRCNGANRQPNFCP